MIIVKLSFKRVLFLFEAGGGGVCVCVRVFFDLEFFLVMENCKRYFPSMCDPVALENIAIYVRANTPKVL